MSQNIQQFRSAYDLSGDIIHQLDYQNYSDAMNLLMTLANSIEVITQSDIFISKYSLEFNHWLNLLVSYARVQNYLDAREVLSKKIQPMFIEMLQDAIIIDGIKTMNLIENMDNLTKKVQDQYKNYIYPNRWKGIIPSDFKQTIKSAIISPCYNLTQIQLEAAGKLKPISDLSVLIAGCGSGEEAVGCALKYSDARFTFVDLSPSSLALCKYYGDALELSNVQYIHDNIITMDLGEKFDIVISVGVIHHLSEPAQGVANLQKHIKDDGILAGMVYGDYGRFEIELFQDALNIMGIGQNNFEAGIQAVPQILSHLKQDSRLHEVSKYEDINKGSNHIVDLLLNVNENKYSIKSLSTMINQGSMQIIGLGEYIKYDPTVYVTPMLIQPHIQSLSFIDKAHLGELLNGHIMKHMFYAVKVANTYIPVDVLPEHWLDLVPHKSAYTILREQTHANNQIEYHISHMKTTNRDLKDIEYPDLSIDQTAWKIISRCNGRSTLRQILKKIGCEPTQPIRDFIQLLLEKHYLFVK